MIARNAIAAAMARCTDLGAAVSAKSVSYARIQQRQAQLFAFIATVHPDYMGTEATVALAGGEYDLAELVPAAERVTDVRISNPGSSGHLAQDKVNLILLDDRDAMLAPRAVIRSGILKGIDSDLAGVATVTIYYSKRPAAVITPDTELEIPEQFQDLLVLDLAKQMIRKVLDVEPARLSGWLELLSGEEKSLLASLTDHVKHFVYGEQRRFRPAGAPPAAADNG